MMVFNYGMRGNTTGFIIHARGVGRAKKLKGVLNVGEERGRMVLKRYQKKNRKKNGAIPRYGQYTKVRLVGENAGNRAIRSVRLVIDCQARSGEQDPKGGSRGLQVSVHSYREEWQARDRDVT